MTRDRRPRPLPSGSQADPGQRLPSPAGTGGLIPRLFGKHEDTGAWAASPRFGPSPAGEETKRNRPSRPAQGKRAGGGTLRGPQGAAPSHLPGQKTPSPELQPTRARSFFSTSSSMSTNTGAISYVYLPGDGHEAGRAEGGCPGQAGGRARRGDSQGGRAGDQEPGTEPGTDREETLGSGGLRKLGERSPRG